ncbi:MAG: hypothetical protein ABIK93_00275 [candidate division WOR-3 bacterium]
MYCPRCKTKMVEQKRSFHKKRKWVCPKCGKVRMQLPKLAKEQ